VARNKKQCKELYLRMFQILTKQGTIHEKDRRTTSIGNARRTMVRN